MMDVTVSMSMTNKMVLDTFKFLVRNEIRKAAPGACDLRTGYQEGYIISKTDLFGEASDEIIEEGISKKATWSHVTARIVSEHLENWLDVFDQEVVVDFVTFNQEVSDAVEEFARNNPQTLIDALKRYL